ncbi:hypothetical protein Hte_011170 [Hypoxylon texense]
MTVTHIVSFQFKEGSSPSLVKNGLTHVFAVNFKDKEDRNYYALEDPVHLEFVKWSEDVVTHVLAIDYVDGDFGDHKL